MRAAVATVTQSRAVTPLTGSLKTAVKVMGAVLVGSACPAAWLIVTVGGVGSKVAGMWALVDSRHRFPSAAVVPPARNMALNLPPGGRPLTATVSVPGPPV